jgi:hypothetical protein
VPRPAFHFSKQEDNEKVRQTLIRGTIVAAAATSLLSLYTAAAFADADADGATESSPGVLAGNSAQVPVSTPVNVCGNSVDAVGVLNPVFGNSCGNGGSGTAGSDTPQAAAFGDAVDSPGVLAGNNVQVPVSTPVNLCGNSADAASILNPAFGNSCGNDNAASSIAQDPLEEGLPVTPEVPDAVTPEVPDSVTPEVPDTLTPAAPVGSDDTPITTVTVPRANPSVESPSTPHSESAPAPQSGTQVDYSNASGHASALAETGSEDVLAASAASAALLLGGVILYRRGRVA